MHGICDNTTTLELLDGIAGTVDTAPRLDRVDNVLRRPASDTDGVQPSLLLVCKVSSLRRFKQLVLAGWRPSGAARHINIRLLENSYSHAAGILDGQLALRLQQARNHSPIRCHLATQLSSGSIMAIMPS